MVEIALLSAVVVEAAMIFALAILLLRRNVKQADAAGTMWALLAEHNQQAQQNVSMIVSELLAHRTLAETGNQAIAGMMLQHSNCHDARAGQRPTPVAAPPQEDTPGPHVGAEVLWGGDEEGEMHPPIL